MLADLGFKLTKASGSVKDIINHVVKLSGSKI